MKTITIIDPCSKCGHSKKDHKGGKCGWCFCAGYIQVYQGENKVPEK